MPAVPSAAVSGSAASLDASAGRLSARFAGDELEISVHLRHINSDPWGMADGALAGPQLVGAPLLGPVVEALRQPSLAESLSAAIGRTIDVTCMPG